MGVRLALVNSIVDIRRDLPQSVCAIRGRRTALKASMTVENDTTEDARAASAAPSAGVAEFEIVAMVLTHRGRVGVFRRSAQVRSDSGRWHCITGYLPSREDPLRHALREIIEETGIEAHNLSLCNNAVFTHRGADGNDWRIHAFHFASATDRVTLNWEHDGARWVPLHEFAALATVPWLGNVLRALAGTLTRELLERTTPRAGAVEYTSA